MATITPALSNNDITVFGGVNAVDVFVDFGPQGDRGSLIFSSAGNPNTLSSGLKPGETLEDIRYNDIAIDILPSSSTYLGVFQYTVADGTDSWEQLTSILPNFGAAVRQQVFDENGQTVINVPLSLITSVPAAQLNPSSNFNIQYSVEAPMPALTTLTMVPDFVVVDDISILSFIITAYVFNGTSIVPFETPSGETTNVHLFLTVV